MSSSPPEITYSIEGYSTEAPSSLQTYQPYWGGFKDPESARRWADNYKDTPHRFRIVKVTREVINEVRETLEEI